jgi:hypothetical protein
VKHLAPWPLNNKYDADEPFRGFCSCARWIANKGRTEQPNSRFALSFWMDQCKSWLRERNSMTNAVGANELILAVLAAGDVHYVAANAQVGTVWELGLAEHGGPRASDAWRQVMETGNVLPPTRRRYA